MKFAFVLQDISAGLQHYQRDNKTPNYATPNRKIRRILGRTPTKLYSPFSIETPPPTFHWRREFPDRVESTPVILSEWLVLFLSTCKPHSKLKMNYTIFVLGVRLQNAVALPNRRSRWLIFYMIKHSQVKQFLECVFNLMP